MDEGFKVKISCLNEETSTQAWSEVLDRHDGSYILRYKTFESCLKGLLIEIKYHDKHLAESPYLIQGK